MRFLDWLQEERVVVPAPSGTLEDVLGAVAEVLPSGLLTGEAQREKFARDLAFGSRGEVVRIHSEVVAVVAEQEGLTKPLAAVAISPAGFQVTAEGKESPGEAQAAVLLLVPGRATAFRARTVPGLRRFFAESARAEAFLEADDSGELLAVPGLDELVFPEQARVAEAVQGVRYRIYPETPVAELVDLMIRRELHAVPVVGEGYEVLGIVTSGDALRFLLGHGPGARAEGVARDVMTRTVLCVSEDQELRDVAQLMVNRDVEQLPVVRDGQLVGFITRDSALEALFGGDEAPGPDENA